MLAPPWELAPPPRGNPGSATAYLHTIREDFGLENEQFNVVNPYLVTPEGIRNYDTVCYNIELRETRGPECYTGPFD